MHVALGPDQSALGEVDWNKILETAIVTAGQIARPGASSPIPTYTPVPYQSPASSFATMAVVGLVAFALFKGAGKSR